MGPVRLDMTRDDAGVVLRQWGEPRPFRRGTTDNEGWVLTRSGTTIFAYVDHADRVNAIEFASPGHGVAADDQIIFDGIDLFTDEADVVVGNLRAHGFRLVDSERGYSTTAPDVLLALWRDGDPFDDLKDLPLYFESALIARPGLYD